MSGILDKTSRTLIYHRKCIIFSTTLHKHGESEKPPVYGCNVQTYFIGFVVFIWTCLKNFKGLSCTLIQNDEAYYLWLSKSSNIHFRYSSKTSKLQEEKKVTDRVCGYIRFVQLIRSTVWHSKFIFMCSLVFSTVHKGHKIIVFITRS